MPFIPSLSLLCVQTLLNTPPAYCITAVWTTEALLKALGSNHADEQLLDRLLERGVLGMQAIKDHTNELPLVKIWWPVPTPTPCTTVTSIQQVFSILLIINQPV
ncbi:hypothetical protein BDF19DRAFT_443428 [Syncephalis fuscata]|nr:hypothetical protein BDF19DRAFT_443428 [Syncephalis fuscata]